MDLLTLFFIVIAIVYLIFAIVMICKVQIKLGDFIVEKERKFLLTINEKLNKTTVHADVYFNLSELFRFSGVNKSHLFSVASVLIGWGVLGTFAGLTCGLLLSNMGDAESTDTLMSAIKTLFSGSSTAFVTSLVGMFLSILFGFILRFNVNKWQNILLDKCQELSEEYYISEQDLQLRYLVSLDVSIERLGEHLENGSRARTQSIVRSISDLGVQLSTQLGESVYGALDNRFSDMIIEFRDVFNNSLTNMSQNLQHSSDSILSAASLLRRTTERLSTVCAPEFLENMKEVLNIVNLMSEKLNSTSEKISESASELGDSFIQLQEGTKNVNNTIGTLDSKISTITTNLNSILSNISVAQVEVANVLDKFDNQSQVYSNVVKQQKEVFDSMSGIVNELIGLQQSLESVFDQINTGINNYINNMTTQTNSMVRDFSNSFVNACTTINNTTLSFKDTLDELKKLQYKYIESLKEFSNKK